MKAIFAISAILLLNFFIGKSIFNNYDYPWNTDWNDQHKTQLAIEYHQEFPALKKRILTTSTIIALSSQFHLSLKISFFIFQFGVLFLIFLALYYLSRLNNLNFKVIQANWLLFAANFSIFFLFHAPIYGYDDLLQFLFLICWLCAFSLENYFLLFLFSVLAIFARESSFILFPAMTLFYLFSNNRKKIPIILFGMVMPAIVYFAYLKALPGQGIDPDIGQRVYYNFQSFRMFWTSFIHFLMVNGPFLYLVLRKEKFSSNDKVFILSLVINTIIVFAFTQAKEARLFFLPNLLLFPEIGKQLMQWKWRFHWKMIVALLVGFLIYNPVDSPANFEFRIYFGLFLALFLSFDPVLSKNKTGPNKIIID